MPADLIILAAVAIFVLLRLRSVLGQKIGHDQPPVPRDATFDEAGKVIQLQPRKQEPAVDTLAENKAREKELETLPEPLREKIVAMRKFAPAFSVDEFIKGSKIALEMVIEAFAKDERDTLKNLLARDLFSEFRKELDARVKQDQYEETTLVAIKSATIEDAELNKSTARVKVRFVTEQIHVMRDIKGKVVEGSASDIDTVEDVWTFEKDLRASNPNWTIVAT